jgi:hypothetical protein
MRLRSAASLSALGVLIAMSGCRDEGYAITDLSTRLVVTPSFIGVTPPAAPVQFEATIGGTPVAVTWASSNTNIATVNATGQVTALDYGFTAITATMVSDVSRKKSASFTVKPPGTTLANGITSPEVEGPDETNKVPGDVVLFHIDVPAGATNLLFEMSGGTGDFDLHTNPGSPPITGELDSGGEWVCRPYSAGNTETCSHTNPVAGWWFALLDVYDAGRGVVLKATITAP